MNKLLGALAVFALCAGVARAAEPLPFSDGTVWQITMVKVKAGMFDDYVKSLAGTWKKGLEEAKKQKIVLSYKILSGDSANRDDWDLMLMVEFKNMAALDGLSEKMHAIMQATIGSDDQIKGLMTKRVEVREIVGEKMMREVILK